MEFQQKKENMSSNILCTLCKGVLNSTDTIFTTICGHIFHFGCMRSCQSKSPSCPACSYMNPQTHEIFLFFEKCGDENVSNNWNNKSKILELHKEIEDYKTNFLHLQEKYAASQDLLRKLEEKNRISTNGISQRNAILSDLEDRIEELEELNQFLTIDNECKHDALTLKAKEITELRSLWLKRGKGAAGSISSKRSTNLERENNIQPTEEMEVPPTQLSMAKTKLQEYINLSEWGSGTMTPSNSSENIDGSLKSYQNIPDKWSLSYHKTDDSVVSSSKYGMDSNSSTDKCLFIKNFPKKDLIYPLKQIILTFVATPQGHVSEDDITDVYVKDGHGKSYIQLPKNVTLFVQFRNRDLKYKFLLNRAQILQTSPSLELIEIDEEIAGIQGTDKSYTDDGKTIKPNTRENINTAVQCTDGLLKPFQNESDNLYLSHDTKDDYSVTSISECSIVKSDSVIRTHANDNVNTACTDNSLLIKNFPKNELIYPLKHIILTFIATKEGSISEDDITKVYVKDGYKKSFSRLPMKVTLFVQFKNQDLKRKFLLNRAQILQTSPSLELVEIDKHNDGTQGTDKIYSDGKTLKPNSRENITTIVESTDGSLKPQQNGSNKNKELIESNKYNDDDIKGTARNYSNGKTMKPNSRENITTKVNGSLKPQQNEPDKLCLSHETKDDYSVTSIPEFLMDGDNSSLIKNIFKNELRCPLNKELAESNKYNDGIKGTARSYSDGKTMKTNSRENVNKKVARTDGSFKPHQNGPDHKLCLSDDPNDDFFVTSISAHPKDNINSTTNNSLLIKNFPKKEVKQPLKNVILKFVATKEGYISENDITKVYIKDGNRKSFAQLPMKVTLFVQFKNPHLKIKFLLNRAQIEEASPSADNCLHDSQYYAIESPRTSTKDYNPSNTSNSSHAISTTTELIQFDNDDDEEDLLKYAKQKLTDKGFSYFFRQNDEVIALKNRSDAEGIRIINKDHVHKLLNSQKKY